MSVNLEKEQYHLPAKQMGVELVEGSEGWYGIPTLVGTSGRSNDVEVGSRFEWHMGKQWIPIFGDLAGIPAVIERCQGKFAWQEGEGTGSVEFHGPFPFPKYQDFPNWKKPIICKVCWEEYNKEKSNG